MSDLDNLAALKRMLENKPEEQSEKIAREKKLINDINAILNGHQSGSVDYSAVKAYDPLKVVEFLSKSSDEVQRVLGGEWLKMDPMAFEALTFTVKQKIQKSTMLLDWNS